MIQTIDIEEFHNDLLPGFNSDLLRLSRIHDGRFLLSFHLFTLVRKGTSMETNKTDEPTNSGVEDVRASEHNARLSFVDTLACDYTPISGRCSRRNQAREVEGVPALGRLPALRSHGSYVDNTLAQVRTHVKVFPPAGGGLFIPRLERRRLSSPFACNPKYAV